VTPAFVRAAPGVHVAVAAYTPPAGEPAWRAEGRAARALLRRLLAEVCGPRPAGLDLARRTGGAPYLPERPELGISLSHTRGWLAAAVGVGHAVGVDVQAPAPVPAGMLHRCCRPDVRARLRTLPAAERAARFARIWSVQEACVKSAGTGLAGRPWNIPVDPDCVRGEWDTIRWLLLDGLGELPVGCAYGPS
jgi:4'-phosphopantetheinyl transferase